MTDLLSILLEKNRKRRRELLRKFVRDGAQRRASKPEPITAVLARFLTEHPGKLLELPAKSCAACLGTGSRFPALGISCTHCGGSGVEPTP